MDSNIKIIAKNKKAFFDYTIEDKYEAGIVLLGSEVKSIRAGNVHIKESYVTIQNGEVFLIGCRISEYKNASKLNHEPLRQKKLLLHKRQIDKLHGKLNEKGLTLIPTKIYIKNNLVKMELGLGKGKRKYDKRESIKRKDIARDEARNLS